MFWVVLAGVVTATVVYTTWLLADRRASARRLVEAVEREGVPWELVETKALEGLGSLVLDSAHAEAQGRGAKVLWWCDADLDETPADEIPGVLEAQGRITNCPAELLDGAALRRTFPKMVIVESRWTRVEVSRATQAPDAKP